MPRFVHRLIFALWFFVAPTALVIAAAPSSVPPRPRILGVAHAALYVSDMARAKAFYEDFLGYASIAPQPGDSGHVSIKINDRQRVELIPGSHVSAATDRLHHLALVVDDADAMRRYLAAKGVPLSSPITVDPIGEKSCAVKDPNGMTIEFVEYLPSGWAQREKGQSLPDTRISARLLHVGIAVGQLDASLAFYGEVLGFTEFWRGSGDGKQLSWLNLKVPEGDDYIEFMLYEKTPTLESLHTLHHLCLQVPDVARAGEILKTRSLPAGTKPPSALRTGINGKRQINYYDPDGTRVEIMEFTTVDGKPRPSSSAPPPSPAPPYPKR